MLHGIVGDVRVTSRHVGSRPILDCKKKSNPNGIGPITNHGVSFFNPRGRENLVWEAVITRSPRGGILAKVPNALGNLKIALRWGGDMDARRRREGGGLEKWGSVSGPLFCVRTDVGAKGTGTQNLARKSFFHQ